MTTYFGREEYTATAGQTDFAITFDYISIGHIYAYVDGVLDEDWSLPTAGTLRFDTGLTLGQSVVIIRETSHGARLVDWANGSGVTESNLDADSLQAFYMSQEAIDIAATSMTIGPDLNWDASSRQIKNVDNPTSADAAANRGYVDAKYAVAGNVPDPESGDVGYPLVATGSGAGQFAFGQIDPAAVDVSSAISTLLAATNAAGGRTALGLGTAATRNTGTGDGNIPVLSGTQMPAVGGTNLLLGSNTSFKGAWVPLGAFTPSGTFSYENNALANYDEILVEMLIAPDTDNAELRMQCKCGSTWYTTNEYWESGYVARNGWSSSDGINGGAAFVLNRNDSWEGSAVHFLAEYSIRFFNGNSIGATGWKSAKALRMHVEGNYETSDVNYLPYTVRYDGIVVGTTSNITGFKLYWEHDTAGWAAGSKGRIWGILRGPNT